ncbi:class II glutamine amidotransferase [Paeniglutamicibacter sp. NPDC012692]|uniref:class II glutamine amidotransferase n=1 Tax=Paeniglutamicibacter sp. NPDC012692 TaxID=3364388 RepID=UPI003686B3DC
MCRLFGMHTGHHPAKASFWLLRAPNSLELQSHYEPDGTGIGSFAADGSPFISKQPISAWHDPEFAFEAKHLESTTFLAHVRYASTGGHTPENTHPFVQDGRLLAHNGVLGGLDELDSRLSLLGTSELVLGQTDSERMFALITAEIRRAAGDVAAGIAAALTWIAENLPVYSLNFILTTPTDLWALRYPATHELYVLERRIGRNAPSEDLRMHSDRIHAHSPELAARSSVIVATEMMSADPAWRPLEPGELLHVDRALGVESSFPLPGNPLRLMTLEQLDPKTAASQHPQTHVRPS